jgi:hypothetical protein
MGILLLLAGVPLASVEHSTTQSGPNGGFMFAVIEFHWPLVTLLATGITGLFLLLKPQHKNIKP